MEDRIMGCSNYFKKDLIEKKEYSTIHSIRNIKNLIKLERE